MGVEVVLLYLHQNLIKIELANVLKLKKYCSACSLQKRFSYNVCGKQQMP